MTITDFKGRFIETALIQSHFNCEFEKIRLVLQSALLLECKTPRTVALRWGV